MREAFVLLRDTHFHPCASPPGSREDRCNGGAGVNTELIKILHPPPHSN